MSDLPPAFLWLCVAVLGLVLGSFTTCVVYRIPRGLSLWRRTDDKSYRSFCPSCGHVLVARDLVPVISWLVQGGRCRYCGAFIGWHYLLIEIGVLVLTIFCFAVFGFSPVAMIASFCIPALAALGAFWRKKRPS